MTSLKRRTVASLVASYVSQLSTSGASFIIKIALARLILPAGWGIYAEAMLVVLAADTLTDVGLSQHVMREKRRPYGNVLLIRVILSAVVIAIIEVFAGYLEFLSPLVVQPVRLLAPLIMIRAVASVPRVYLDRELMVHRTLLPQISGLVVMGTVSLTLAVYGLGVYALVIGTLAQECVYCGLIWAAVARRIPLELTLSHTWQLIRGSKYLFLIAVVGFVLQQGDIAITGTILDPSEVGLYAMAFTIVALTSRLVEMAVYRVLYPLFCQYAERLAVLGKVYVTASLAVYAIEAPVFFFLLFNSQFFVSLLLGEKWMPMAHLLGALAVAGIVNPYSTFGIEVLRATKRDRMLTLASVTGAATLTVFGTILTLRYGAIGMVAANYIVLGGVLIVIALLRVIPAHVRDLTGKLLIVYAISFAAAALPYLALSSHGTLQNAVSIAAVVFSWALFYRLYGMKLLKETLSLLDSPTEVEAA